jgi:hypothetical protein
MAAADALKHAWASPNLFATSALVAFIDTYTTEALQWHPVTIQMEIEHDFHVDLPHGVYERLLTAITLLTEDGFFRSPVDFARACVVLSGHVPTADSMLLPDASDVAWGVTEALLIHPPDAGNDNPFTEEITGFIGHILDSEGILNPPDILRIATRDHELVDRADYGFSDDPATFAAISQMEASKTDDINQIVAGRMRALLSQLQSLPLRHAKVEATLVARMLKNLPTAEDLPLPG